MSQRVPLEVPSGPQEHLVGGHKGTKTTKVTFWPLCAKVHFRCFVVYVPTEHLKGSLLGTY